MKFESLFFITVGLFWLLTACAGGSSSGGGSAQTGQGTPVAPVTYNNADLAGTWRWNARRQTNSDTLSGTMAFDREVRLIGFSPDRCPGSPVPNSEFWLWDNGFVKGHFYNFCSDATAEVKFGIYFSPTKKTLTGIMDLHYVLNSGETYDRFDVTLTKL
jgi:hypothetical protein